MGEEVRRVVITGFVADSRDLSPALDKKKRKDFEIWSFNNDMELVEHAARHFEMHELDVYDRKALGDAKPSPEYLRALHDGLGIPVYMLKEEKTIPGSIAYPVNEMVREFETDYFTNSISYMLALAISEQVDEIHLYGIDMALQHESAWERPSIEYFLGYARGAGIKVVIPDESDLLKCLGLYGYVPTYEYEAMLREREERTRRSLEWTEAEARRLSRDSDYFEAAIREMEFWGRQWVHPGDGAIHHKTITRRKFLEKRSDSYRKKAEKAWRELGQYEQRLEDKDE